MQGDAARTINTYANQVKVLEANLKNVRCMELSQIA